MRIPAYQIHNVLNTYSLQLFKAGTVSENTDSASDPSIKTSPETIRMALIEKIATEIVQRITRLDTLNARHIAPSPVPVGRADAQSAEFQNNQFVFNTLDTHNIKTSRTLSIEDSIFFIKRDPPE
ncbi:MAG: hypothetical protein HY881_12400 [Deltaproteobacteria bacterium]|nr:hypothetical protein [Deltaproteobacteria bacterium]